MAGNTSIESNSPKETYLAEGLVVWAQYEKYPSWPGIIVKGRKSSKREMKTMRLVQFFRGKKQRGMVSLNNIKEYTAHMRLKSIHGPYQKNILNACAKADIYIQEKGPNFQRDARRVSKRHGREHTDTESITTQFKPRFFQPTN